MLCTLFYLAVPQALESAILSALEVQLRLDQEKRIARNSVLLDAAVQLVSYAVLASACQD
jgi:hypothetical protein